MIPNTKYVTFELLMHAAIVAGEIWGFTLEPAGIINTKYFVLVIFLLGLCWVGLWAGLLSGWMKSTAYSLELM